MGSVSAWSDSLPPEIPDHHSSHKNHKRKTNSTNKDHFRCIELHSCTCLPSASYTSYEYCFPDLIAYGPWQSMGPACSHGTTKDAPTQATRKAWMSICRKEDLDLELMAFKWPKDSPRVIPSHWRLICRKRQMMCMTFSIWCPGWYSCLAEIGGGVLDINPSKTPRDGNPNIGTSINSI